MSGVVWALAHGWALDPALWTRLAPLLDDDGGQGNAAGGGAGAGGHRCVVFNLGFYGDSPLHAPNTPNTPYAPHTPDAPGALAAAGGKRIIGVGHSLGFAWLLNEARLPLDAIVSIGGFARFTRSDDFAAGVAAERLAAMRRSVRRDASAAVDSFVAASGGGWRRRRRPNRQRLEQATGWLERWDLRRRIFSRLAGGARLLALAAEDDAIVPPALSRACFAASGGLQLRADGGHLLPLSQPAWCALALRRFAASLQPEPALRW